MIQVPVKWVLEKDLFVSKERVSDYEERDNIACPVVPLSALREVVEYLREQVKYHDPLCIDNIEEDGCTCGHATATRLLASLGEVGT